MPNHILTHRTFLRSKRNNAVAQLQRRNGGMGFISGVWVSANVGRNAEGAVMGLRLHKGDIDTRSVEDVRSLTVAVPCWCIAFSLL
jgi:hypothetical protein